MLVLFSVKIIFLLTSITLIDMLILSNSIVNKVVLVLIKETFSMNVLIVHLILLDMLYCCANSNNCVQEVTEKKVDVVISYRTKKNSAFGCTRMIIASLFSKHINERTISKFT